MFSSLSSRPETEARLAVLFKNYATVMSAPSTTPASVDTIPRVWRSKSPPFHISRGSVVTHSLNSIGSEWEPELDRNSPFNGPSFTVSHTYSCPEVPCFPRTYYHSRSTSATSSSRPTSPDNNAQTPPSPRTTSFLAAPSPLCLGPSLSHIDLDNDLETENVCPDENDEFPELVTPVSFPIDTSNQQHVPSHPTSETRTSNLLSYPTSDDTHQLDFGSTRPRAMTLPAGSVSQLDSPGHDINDGTMTLRGGDLYRGHHTLHRKKSMFDLRHEFQSRSSTRGGT